MGHGRHATLAGARVYVEEWGRGPTLLCLHGLGGGSYFFGGLGAALAGSYRTLALDFPGSGVSPALPLFSFDALAEIVVDLAAHETGPVLCVLGHSMGTIVALEAFRRQRHLARGFIAVGGLSEPLPSARSRIAERAEAIRRSGMTGLGGAVAAANFSRATLDDRPELVTLFARLFETQPPGGYVGAAEALARWTSREPPPLKDVRCLAMTGEEDLYAPPDAAGAFARTLPVGTRLEILPGCAHLPFLEQPRACATIIERFLAEFLP
jgi:pimeloyl-ACP methyl ester carboxylesterase